MRLRKRKQQATRLSNLLYRHARAKHEHQPWFRTAEIVHDGPDLNSDTEGVLERHLWTRLYEKT